MDVYTEKAVKASKLRNPIQEVGASALFGVDDPLIFEDGSVEFSVEIGMTPEEMINELSGFEKSFFKEMLDGKFAKSLCKIYTNEN